MIYIVCTVAGVALLLALFAFLAVIDLAGRIVKLRNQVDTHQRIIIKQTELLGHMNTALEKAGV